MSSFFTDPDTPGEKRRTARPPIWANGNQRPPFDSRAFLRVSLAGTRERLTPILTRAATGTEALAVRVAQGAFAPLAARLGRVARAVPSRAVTARATFGCAGILSVAAETARGAEPLAPMPFKGWDGAAIPASPSPTAPEPLAAVMAPPVDPWLGDTEEPSIPHDASSAGTTLSLTEPEAVPPAPAPMRPPRAAPALTPDLPEADRSTLDAIRSMIHTAEVAPVRPAATHRTKRAAAPVPPPPPAPRGMAALPQIGPQVMPEPGMLQRLAGQGLGYALLAVAFPIGVLHATIAHLRGEDLRLRD